jgi:hypothetical protein
LASGALARFPPHRQEYDEREQVPDKREQHRVCHDRVLYFLRNRGAVDGNYREILTRHHFRGRNNSSEKGDYAG